MTKELIERELQNTSINDVSLADYIKENYVPIEVLDKIRAEIKAMSGDIETIADVLAIIDKYKAESEVRNE